MIKTNFQQHPSKIQVLVRTQSQLPINLSQQLQQQKLEYVQQQKIAKQPVRQTLQYQMNPHINQLQFKQSELVYGKPCNYFKKSSQYYVINNNNLNKNLRFYYNQHNQDNTYLITLMYKVYKDPKLFKRSQIIKMMI